MSQAPGNDQATPRDLANDGMAVTSKEDAMAAKNSEGVLLLTSNYGEQGAHKALKMLREAMANLDEIKHSQLEHRKRRNVCTDSYAPGECGARSLSLANMTREAEWNQIGMPSLRRGRIGVYNKPISISPTDDLNFCRASLLFNASLIHHAIGRNTANKPMLQCALDLYDLSLQAFDSIEVPADLLQSCPPDKLAFHIQIYSLAAWNNQAHIHLLFQNEELAFSMLAWQKTAVQPLYGRALGVEEADDCLLLIVRDFLFNDYCARNPLVEG